MKDEVLFVGGSKGSWQVRGKQIGSALGVRYSAILYPHLLERARTVVLVKRGAHNLGARVRGNGRRLIWDVLDCWRQPEWNARPLADHISDVVSVQKKYGITTLIGATKAMAQDIGGIYIPHHSRIGLVPTPPRTRAEAVAYEGQPAYLGAWKAMIERACASLGLRFEINPPDLSKADILVAFRDGTSDGPVCRRWKSGVKYVNALAAGRPVVTQYSSSLEEIDPVGCVVDSKSQHWLELMLEAASGDALRELAYHRGVQRAHEFTIDTIAQRYREILWAS